MGQTRKEAKLVLFAGVDEATLQRSIAHFHRLEQAEQGASDAMVKRIQTVRQSLSASVANAKQEAVVSAEVARSINTQIRSREQLIATIDRQANAQRNAILKGGAASAAAPAGISGGGKASGALAALGSVLPGPVGDIARQAGNFSRLTEQIERMGGSATGLTAALGPAALAMVSIGVAFAALKKKIDEAQRSLDASVQRQVDYYKLIATGTTEQIQTEIKARQIEHDAYVRAARDIDDAVTKLDIFGKAVVTIGGVFGLGPVKNFKELQDQANEAAADINTLTQGLSSSEVAANDAAAAAIKQAKETDKVAKAAEKVAIKQAEQAKTAEAITALYDTINSRQRSAADTIRKQEFNLTNDRLRIFADYAQRIKDAEVQAKRDEAREARRAAFDRLVALKQRELSEFDLLLRGDFAGVSRSRREGQVQAEVDRYRTEFEANEKLISQRERDFDDQLSLNRQLAELTTRISQERIGAAQSELGFMREQVSEFFRLKGYLGDVSRFTNDQITRFYKIVAQIAGAPQINFGAKLGSAGVSAAPPSFGQPAQSQSSGFGSGGGFAPTGGFQPTNTTSNVFNINGVTDPKAVARAVDERLRAVTRQ